MLEVRAGRPLRPSRWCGASPRTTRWSSPAGEALSGAGRAEAESLPAEP